MYLKRIDRPFLITVCILVGAGFFIFASAALGMLARSDTSLSVLAISQIASILLGSIGLIATATIPHRIWRKYALYIFGATYFGTLLVFIPGIGVTVSGAERWIDLGIATVQPAEFLKIGFVIYLAAWFSGVRTHIQKWQYGLVPFLIILGITGIPLFFQPDTGTIFVIAAAGSAMFLAAGARWRDIGILCALGAGALALLALVRPYVLERIRTFIDPSVDPLGMSYQVQQALIAVGSGEVFGRGFGQSIQKFNFLPTPISDSVFAVAAEELGFIGAMLIISLFLFIALQGLKIAVKSPDYFGALLVVGLVVLIVVQSFTNIAAMLGVFPLTGMPLIFISHGGSAMIGSLIAVGLILSVSQHRK